MWNWLKNLFGAGTEEPAPDPTPDPEDKAVYDYLVEVEKEFAAAGGVFQILPGGAKPSDTAETLSAATKALEPVGYVWWVDVYDGPKGTGYQVCFEVKRDKATFRKVVNFGPETWREQDWKEVPSVTRG